ncbi:MAG TPA: [FeFe] hydrogenase H-cluster radical SAM maturase HydE [Acidobacteriaceae bacterium]
MPRLAHEEIVSWLRETDPAALEQLFARADATRRTHVGDAVHLRGLIEISNHCVRQCHYCGLRSERSISRYRMSREEILACAHTAVRLGFGSVVLQAGEDFGIDAAWLAEILRSIKAETPLAITLSLGERLSDELKLWRDVGADRYLLRFETSDPALYAAIHPQRGTAVSDRIALLHQLRELGYEIGSGVMTGIPGQTYDMLARDIELFEALDLDMIGIGPFLAHPDTPLGANDAATAGEDQVPSSEWMVLKTVALTRLVCPQANLPSTTALATINTVDGREHGLESGANVFMPILTPAPYRQMYEIYPGKACIDEDVTQCNHCLRERIDRLGRFVGEGPGGRYTREDSRAEPLPRKGPRWRMQQQTAPQLVVLP